MINATQPDGKNYIVPFLERQESTPQDVPGQMMIPQVVFNRLTNCINVYAASEVERSEIVLQLGKFYNLNLKSAGVLNLARYGGFHHARINLEPSRSPKSGRGKGRS